MSDHRRACDVCGDDTWPFRKMAPIGDGKYACPYDARGFTDDMLDAAGPRPTIPPAIRPRPAEQVRETPDLELYQKAEARILNLLTADFGDVRSSIADAGPGVPPRRFVNMKSGAGKIEDDNGVDVESLVETSAVTCMYLYSVIAEDRRPKVWIDRAKTKLRALADLLLTWQAGGPYQASQITTWLGRATASTDFEYGAFLWPYSNSLTLSWSGASDEANIYTKDVYLGGLALLRAYQALGDEKYRQGYRMALTCLRRCQSPGKLTGRYFVSRGTSTSARFHPGMWPWNFTKAAGGASTWEADESINVDDLWGLEFIAAAKALEGDTTYGDTTAVGEMTDATAATLSAMAAEARAFWVNGVYDHTTGATKTGLSTSYMSRTYRASTSNGSSVTQNSTWLVAGAVFPPEWAQAIRGWNAYYGFDSVISPIWDFFMATASSADHAITATTTPFDILYYGTDLDEEYNNLGTYNPKLTWSDNVDITVGTPSVNTTDSSTWYAWECMGLLAPLLSSREPSNFTEAKRKVSMMVRRRLAGTRGDDRFAALNLLGSSGFSFQPSGDRVWAGFFYDAYKAALIGLAYREQPRVFVVRDH